MPEIAGFTTMVGDMRRSLEFYRRLGLRVPSSADHQGFVSVAIGSGTHLAFEHRSLESSDQGRLSIGVRCGSPDAVDALYHSLASDGATGLLEPFDAPWGARHCRLLDPDGNTVELFAPLP
jgi:catechol 2,3-dioxygenase-like lactoylglutathione lyase family enzyme